MTLWIPRAVVVALSLAIGGCAAEADSETSASISVALSAPAPPAEDRFYALVFGYDDANFSAAGSHSFATFVRAGTAAPFDVTTISWLPRFFTGKVCVDAFHLRCPPEPGRRYDLETTLGFARDHSLVMWGPLEVTESLYAREIAQAHFLDSGEELYIANDLGVGLHRRAFRHLPGGAINCIHAITDTLDFEQTGFRWGARASRLVVDQILPYVIDRGEPVEWVVDGLPLAGVPLQRLAL